MLWLQDTIPPPGEKKMLSFEIRQTESGFILSGNQLERPLTYPEQDAAVRLVGFLSQKEGSELRLYGVDGNLKSIQRREPAMPLGESSLGSGLRGTSKLGN